MTRRAPLPKITECVEKNKRGEWLTATRLLQAAYPFVVVCALCLAHVHLEFERADMLVQQSHLQGQQRQLVRQENFLSRQNEELCDPDSLKIRARRDLNMQQLDFSRQKVVVTVPHELHDKYTRPGAPSHDAVAVAQIRQERQKQGLQNRLFAFIDANRANAKGVEEQEYQKSKFASSVE